MGKVKSAVMDGQFCAGCGKNLGGSVGHERLCPDCAPFGNMIGGGGDGTY